MVQHGERKHALLSASGASRWMNCTPSARLEDALPEEASTYADEGTFAHELAELYIKNHIDPKDKKTSEALKRKREGSYYSTEMRDYVYGYVGYVIERFNAAKADDPNALILLEEKIDLRTFIPESFGTLDVAIVSSKTLELIDLKYGKGVKVDAVDNAQLRVYSLGMIDKYQLIYSFENVRYTIVQPRLDHISSEDVTLDHLVAWGVTEVAPLAQLAFVGKGAQKVGDWCRFCKVKPTCRAMRDFALREMEKDFSDGVEHRNEADMAYLTKAEIEQAYLSVDIISSWIKSVREYVLKEALSGTEFENLKLVTGRAVRKWVDEYEAIKVLRALNDSIEDEQIINTKIKGIGDIEKLLGKEVFADLGLTVKLSGAPTVVPKSDKRPALVLRESLTEAFSDELIEN